MHGRITLESTLGTGTTATFSVPFNKPQYHNGAMELIDIGSLSDRLQSEMSVSCNSSEYEQMLGSPPHRNHTGFLHRDSKPKLPSMTPPVAPTDLELSRDERAKVNILLVEDK